MLTTPASTSPSRHVLLDLFAGTGWGVAAHKLGLTEYGVEIMKQACETREKNGFTTIYNDVWDGLLNPSLVPAYTVLIASPPCQSYSMAGQGAGRKAMEQVLKLVHDKAHEDPAKLVAAAEELGDKTVLVLAPLAHIFRDRPEHVFLEQVPSVQPVWNLYKTVLEEYGYAVWTGPVQSEMYGVPQSRRRAYLIAHRDREEAFPPPPTHSRYYARNPQKMDEGVLPWIPLADVLDEREEELPAWAYVRPSTTIVGSFRPDILAAPGYRKPGDPPRQKTPGSIQVSFREAARIQTYPEDFEFAGGLSKQYLQVGNAVPPLLAEHMLNLVLEDEED